MNNQSKKDIRDSIIGLGENSIRKNYYPQLKKKVLEVEELNKTLEQKVTQRTEELNEVLSKYKDTNIKLQETLDELKITQKTLIETEKLAALGELVAGIAHEINTPIGISLTGITHFIDLTDNINDLYKSNSLDEIEFKKYLDTSIEVSHSINKSLIKASQLVDNFKQIAVDQTNEEKREFNLCEYIETILKSIQNIINKTKLSIKIDCDKNLVISSYPGTYSQIITNLILNTITHGYEANETGHVNINVNKEQNMIKIVYEDFGKGIKREDISKIFNPFFTTSRKDGGSGLGLYISYNLVTNNLNGKITCESIQNKKTTFTFTDTNI